MAQGPAALDRACCCEAHPPSYRRDRNACPRLGGTQVIWNVARALHLVHRDLRKAGVYRPDLCFGRGSAPCRKKGTYSRLEKHWEIDDCGLPVAQIGAQVISNLVRALHLVHRDRRKAGA